MKDNVRRVAVSALSRWERDGKYINLEVDATLDRTDLTGPDRALAAAIIYGVSERKLTLDYEIERLSERKIRDFDEVTLAALRAGLYQIFYMDRVPNHAAVNETVDAVPKKSRGLVNAVLRRAIREGGEPKIPSIKEGKEDSKVRHYELLYSVPAWIISSWMKDYGEEDAVGLLKSANSQPKVTLRVNTVKITRDELAARFLKDGIETKNIPFADDMLELSGGVKITELYGFDEGYFFVQDPASRLCSMALGAMPGETVADVCAAPGGKSFSIAVDMKNEGKLYSYDLHENKVRLIRRGAERLGINIIDAKANDGTKPEEALFGKCDRVLCDVPCSGLGVIAKKPDIRYKEEKDVSRLPEVGYAILSASTKLLKAGGVLVYSTCTTRCAENEDVRERFLSEHPDFIPYFPENFPIKAEGAQITLMPHKHGTDGFYIAGFKKK